jgi:hypothetical protein
MMRSVLAVSVFLVASAAETLSLITMPMYADAACTTVKVHEYRMLGNECVTENESGPSSFVKMVCNGSQITRTQYTDPACSTVMVSNGQPRVKVFTANVCAAGPPGALGRMYAKPSCGTTSVVATVEHYSDAACTVIRDITKITTEMTVCNGRGQQSTKLTVQAGYLYRDMWNSGDLPATVPPFLISGFGLDQHMAAKWRYNWSPGLLLGASCIIFRA